MIKLAFMTDSSYVIGASTLSGNMERFELLPQGLGEQMKKISVGDHFVAGSNSIDFYKNDRFPEGAILYILSKNPDFSFEGSANIQVVGSIESLIEKFKNSNDTLVVIGGRQVFNSFLPYADQLNVAITNNLVPGDIIFDQWQNDDFLLQDKEDWGDGITYYYKRR